MEIVRRIGFNSAQNELNSFFDFNSPYAWLLESGAGTAEHSMSKSFYGERCLFIEQTDIDFGVSFSSSEKTIIKHNDSYSFSFYALKTQLFEMIRGNLIIKKNGIAIGIDNSFSLGSNDSKDISSNWVRFMSEPFFLEKDDEITFTINVKENSNKNLNKVELYLDGFFMYKNSRMQSVPPVYVPSSIISNNIIDNKSYLLIEGNKFEYIKSKNNNTQFLIENEKAVNGNISDNEFGILLSYKGQNLDPKLFSSWNILISQ